MGAAFHNLQGDNRLFFSFLFFFFSFGPASSSFLHLSFFFESFFFLIFKFFKGHIFIVLVDILVLQYFVWVFFLYFSFPFYDIDIVHLNSIIYLAFDHFIFQLAFVRLLIQSHKCSIWLFFGLSSDLFIFIEFCCLLNNIRILGIMFMFLSFSSFFLQL